MLAKGGARRALPVKVNKNILCVSAVFKLREIFRPFLPLTLALAQAVVAAAVIVIVAADAAAAAAVAFVVWKFQHLFYMHCLGRFMFC